MQKTSSRSTTKFQGRMETWQKTSSMAGPGLWAASSHFGLERSRLCVGCNSGTISMPYLRHPLCLVWIWPPPVVIDYQQTVRMFVTGRRRRLHPGLFLISLNIIITCYWFAILQKRPAHHHGIRTLQILILICNVFLIFFCCGSRGCYVSGKVTRGIVSHVHGQPGPFQPERCDCGRCFDWFCHLLCLLFQSQLILFPSCHFL